LVGLLWRRQEDWRRKQSYSRVWKSPNCDSWWW
jgi:hypothetical protein